MGIIERHVHTPVPDDSEIAVHGRAGSPEECRDCPSLEEDAFPEFMEPVDHEIEPVPYLKVYPDIQLPAGLPCDVVVLEPAVHRTACSIGSIRSGSIGSPCKTDIGHVHESGTLAVIADKSSGRIYFRKEFPEPVVCGLGVVAKDIESGDSGAGVHGTDRILKDGVAAVVNDDDCLGVFFRPLSFPAENQGALVEENDFHTAKLRINAYISAV